MDQWQILPFRSGQEHAGRLVFFVFGFGVVRSISKKKELRVGANAKVLLKQPSVVAFATDQALFVRLPNVSEPLTINLHNSMTIGDVKFEIWRQNQSLSDVHLWLGSRCLLNDEALVSSLGIRPKSSLRCSPAVPSATKKMENVVVVSMEHLRLRAHSALAVGLQKVVDLDQRTTFCVGQSSISVASEVGSLLGTSQELFVTVCQSPGVFVTFRECREEVFPEDTSFSFRWRLFERHRAKDPASSSLWCDFKSSGDGRRTGHMILDDEAIYEKARVQDGEWVLEELNDTCEHLHRFWAFKSQGKKQVIWLICFVFFFLFESYFSAFESFANSDSDV